MNLLQNANARTASLGLLALVTALAVFVGLTQAEAHAQTGDLPPGAHAHGTRTGIDTVDQVLEAMESGGSFVELLQPTPTECSTSPDFGGTFCPEGTPEGTVVDSILLGACEGAGHAVDDPAVIEAVEGLGSGSFSLYGVAAGSYGLEGGRLLLYVTSGPGPNDWTKLVLGDAGIMAISGGCAETVEAAFAEETDVEFPPADANNGDDPTPSPAPPETGTGLANGGPGGQSGIAIVVGRAAAGATALGAIGWRSRL